MSGTSYVQFEDNEGNSMSGILQVPNTIDAAQLKSLVSTTLDLFINGRPIVTTLEKALNQELLNDNEKVKKIKLCEDLPASQPALFCAGTYSGHEGPVLAIKLRKNLAVTGGGDMTVRFWDMTTRTVKKIVAKHSHWVMSVDIDDENVVSGGMDGVVNVYDHDGNHIRSIARHRSGISAVVVSQGKIISCGRDGVCNMLHKTGELVASWSHGKPIKCLTVEDDLVVTGDIGGCIKVHRDGRYLCDLKGHVSQVNAVCIYKNWVVSGDDSGLIIIWKDWLPWRRVMHKREVISLSISPNGQSFASASFDKTACLWSLDSGEILASYSHAGPVYKVFAMNNLIISSSRDRTIKAYRVSAKKFVSDLVAESEIYDFCYDSGAMVCGTRSGKVQFFQ